MGHTFVDQSPFHWMHKMYLQLGETHALDLEKGCHEEVIRPQHARGKGCDFSMYLQAQRPYRTAANGVSLVLQSLLIPGVKCLVFVRFLRKQSNFLTHSKLPVLCWSFLLKSSLFSQRTMALGQQQIVMADWNVFPVFYIKSVSIYFFLRRGWPDSSV